MNQVLDIIYRRRSWRSYDDKQVPKNLVQICIDSANEAPSGMNGQPWRFVVIQNAAIRQRLFEAAYPKWRKVYERLISNPDTARDATKYGQMEDPIFYKAPTIIYVIGTRVIDCALACENLMLAAESLNLANCYVVFGSMVKDDPEILKILNLKEKEEIYGPILLGYPKGIPEIPQKKKANVQWVE